MIDHGIKIEFLDPELWTHLGEIIQPFAIQPMVLHVLEKEGGSYRAVCSGHKNFDICHYLEGGEVDTERIFRDFCDMMEIRVYTLDGLRTCYRKIQQSDIYDKDIDEAMSDIYREFGRTEGIAIISRRERENLWYLDKLKRILGEIKNDSIFLLWITNDKKLYFNCILEMKSGKLVRISTSDRYGTVKDFDKVCELIENEFELKPYTVCMELAVYRARFHCGGGKNEGEGKPKFTEGEVYACHGSDVVDSGTGSGGDLL